MKKVLTIIITLSFSSIALAQLDGSVGIKFKPTSGNYNLIRSYNIEYEDLTFDSRYPLVFSTISTGAFEFINHLGTELFALKGIDGTAFFKGNIGIGIKNPDYALHVSSPDNQLMRFTSTNGTWLDFESTNAEIGSRIWSIGHVGTSNKFAVYQRDGTGEYRFLIDKNGNVGIGTTAPTEKFHISGSGLVRSLVESSDNHAYYVVEGAAGKGSFVDFYRKGNGRIWHTGLRNGSNNFEFRLNDQSTVLALKDNGSVGIGTTNTGTYKLSVNGSIRSKEVKVEANWSDFVFYQDYELRTLEEVEKHINDKGHLPEIPSEAEVTENGINLGEMDAKLLQKIEELTLYMIDMNKQMQQLKSENQELKEKVTRLENQ